MISGLEGVCAECKGYDFAAAIRFEEECKVDLIGAGDVPCVGPSVGSVRGALHECRV